MQPLCLGTPHSAEGGPVSDIQMPPPTPLVNGGLWEALVGVCVYAGGLVFVAAPKAHILLPSAATLAPESRPGAFFFFA